MIFNGKFRIAPLSLVIACAALFTVFFGTIGVLRYHALTYPDYDFTINIQKYWSILNSDGRMSTIGDANILGNSFEFIAYPLSLVYLLLFQSQEALLFLQPFVVACGALAVYRIARLKLSGWWSACLSLSFLLNPATWYMVLGQYYDLIFCIIPLSMAFYYLKKDRFLKFVICIVVSILFRADISLVIFMFGIYAALDGKKIKWVIFPMALSLTWVSVFILWLRPQIYPRVYYEQFYLSIGNSFYGIAFSLVAHPLKTISSILTWQNTVFAFKMLLPVCMLPLFSLKEVMIPALAILRQSISSFGQHHNIVLHNFSYAIIFIYAAAASGLANILKKRQGMSRMEGGALFFLIIAATISTDVWYGPITDWNAHRYSIRKSAQNERVRHLMNKIPKDASVAATFRFSSHLANRKHLYFLHYVTDTFLPFPYEGYRIPEDAEYAIADFLQPISAAKTQKKDSDLLVKEFFEKGKWGPVGTINNVCLLKRGAANKDNFLYMQDYDGPLPEVPLVSVGEALAIMRYDMDLKDRDIAMTIYWKCLNKTDDGMCIMFKVFDEQGEEVERLPRPVCYGIYPINRWKKGEVVADRFNLFFSSERVKPGRRYRLKAECVSIISLENIPLASKTPGVVDSEGMLVIGEFKL
ncbi:MAG: DUF2079 domain-containing protein [Candidatus Omnitrophota bacterium]